MRTTFMLLLLLCSLTCGPKPVLVQVVVTCRETVQAVFVTHPDGWEQMPLPNVQNCSLFVRSLP